jgi:ankyrin repeat protein
MNTRRRQLVVATLIALATGITLAAEPAAEPTPAQVSYFRAIQIDNVAGVKKALAGGVGPNVREPGGETGLIVAIRNDASQVATVLMDQPGIDLEARAPNGNTALMMAAFRKNMPLVVDLLRRGAHINQPGWSALHYAAAGGSVEITNLLLDRQAHIDAEAPSGMTPLMLAAREGQEDVVKVLLARGADATLKDGGFHLTASGFALKADKPWIAKAIDAHLASQTKAKR